MNKVDRPGQHVKVLDKAKMKKISDHYLLYLPENYGEEEEKFPLVLFLHGAGERGSDIEKVKNHGIPKLIAHGKKFPFVAVSPQCHRYGQWDIETLDLLLDETISAYRVDHSRVYVTGLSMGGHATWTLAMLHPERFAAIAPICGWGDVNQVCRLKDIPIWTFHGKLDNIIPVEETVVLVDELKKCGGNVKMTIYPKAMHDSWTQTYENEELYRWMLGNTKIDSQ